VGVGSPDQYCREIEAYLCRKNDGHLIRIVGPAFERVIDWAARGVPLKVACSGIDRYFERYYAKGPRRRPVRVEFCEADVFDAFDEWRRAVGMPAQAATLVRGNAEDVESPEDSRRRSASLPAHVDRVIARLTALRGGSDRSLDGALEAIIRELDAARAGVKGLRGDARRLFIQRLRALDAELIAASRGVCDPSTLARLDLDAAADLAPFKDRLSMEAFDESRRAAVNRLIRERSGLPTVAFD